MSKKAFAKIATPPAEELWEYDIPSLNEAITTIVVSLDGAYVLMRDEGYREAMVGNISLYDVTGNVCILFISVKLQNTGKALFFSAWNKKLLRSKNTIPMPSI